MAFLQTIQKALQESLAVQQRAALVQILRQRASTMTFDDLCEVLSSPVGKSLGPMRIAEAFGVPSQALPEPAPAAVTRKQASKAKTQPVAAAVAPTAARERKTTRVKRKQAKKAAPGRRSPPGVSAEKRAEFDRYDEAVLNALRDAGGWVAAGDVRPRVGGTSEVLRLAFKRLAERHAIVREGARANTRYKIAG